MNDPLLASIEREVLGSPVDLPFLNAVHDGLISAGLAEPHGAASRPP